MGLPSKSNAAVLELSVYCFISFSLTVVSWCSGPVLELSSAPIFSLINVTLSVIKLDVVTPIPSEGLTILPELVFSECKAGFSEANLLLMFPLVVLANVVEANVVVANVVANVSSVVATISFWVAPLRVDAAFSADPDFDAVDNLDVVRVVSVVVRVVGSVVGEKSMKAGNATSKSGGSFSHGHDWTALFSDQLATLCQQVRGNTNVILVSLICRERRKEKERRVVTHNGKKTLLLSKWISKSYISAQTKCTLDLKQD